MLRGNLRRALALVRRRTFAAPALRVRLFERAGCALCDEAHRALRRIGLDRPLAVERVDIEADVGLRDRYALRIPVLRAGEAEIDAAGLDDAALARWLDEVAPRDTATGERPADDRVP